MLTLLVHCISISLISYVSGLHRAPLPQRPRLAEDFRELFPLLFEADHEQYGS